MWKPDSYDGGLPDFDHQLMLKFPVAKLLDWAGKEEELEAHDNIFSLVVLAHLKSMETKGNMKARAQAKMYLIRLLFRHGYQREQVADLLIFIDWVLTLPDKIDKDFWQEVTALKEVQSMEYMPSFMRDKYEQGINDGMEKGKVKGAAEALLTLLGEKFGNVPAWAMQKIEAATPEALDRWFINVLRKSTIDEVLS